MSHLVHSNSHSEQRIIRRGPFQQENNFSQDTTGLQSKNAGMRPRSAGSGGPRVLRHMQSDLGPGGTEAQSAFRPSSLAVAAAAAAPHQAPQTPRRNISALLAAATVPEEVKPLAMVSTPSVTTIPAPGAESDAT